MRSLLAASFVVVLALAATGTQACPLVDVKAVTVQIDQEYGTSPLNPFIWYLSPCAVGFPSGQQACSVGSGFFGQWDIPSVDNGKCQQLQDTQTQKWSTTTTSAGNGYQAEFSDSVTGNTGTVIAICDTSATNMQPYGNVIATAIQGGYNYKLTFKSNAICGATPTPAPPTPAGQTTPAPAGSGSSNSSNSGSGSGNNANTLVNCTVNGVKHVNVTVADCEAYAAPPPPKKEEGGCGGGCAFLIIFFVGGFLYVVGAVAWNFKGGKRGKELAPHPEFWGEVPGLIKDGAIFFAAGVCALVDKCRGKGGSKGDGGYSSV